MGRGGGDSGNIEDCEYWFAAVCAQIYTSMIDKGLRYGIISTGVRYVFVLVDPSNPSVLRYSVCHASRSQDIVATPLMRVVSLALLALQNGSLPPGRQLNSLQDGGGLIWCTATASFTTANSPDPQMRAETESWKDSPAQDDRSLSASDLSDLDGVPPALDTVNRCDDLAMSSPPDTPLRSSLGRAAVEARWQGSLYPPPPLQGESHGKRGRQDDDSDLNKVSTRPAKRIKTDNNIGLIATPASPISPIPFIRSLAVESVGLGDRQFCTQKCLQSLVLGPNQHRPPADTSCPNYNDHKVVPNHEELCERLLAQLTTRVDFALPRFSSGHEFLNFASGHTQMIKLRLHDSGYVLLAKAFMPSDIRIMHREARFYTHLRHIQGRYIPVCLGTIELPLAQAFIHGGFRFTGLLLLSWAGIGPDQWIYVGGGLGHGGEADYAFTQALQVEVRKALTKFTRRAFFTEI